MALEKQLILAVCEEDGYVSPLFVSNPSATLTDFHDDWAVAHANVKVEQEDEYTVEDVVNALTEQGYEITYGEPIANEIRVSY